MSTTPDLPPYGRPLTLPSEEAAWLRDLNSQIWDEHTDRFAGVHRFPKQSRPVLPDEVSRCVSLIRSFNLPCVLYSSPYGELSMGVFDHSEHPGVPPEFVILIGRDHVGLPAGFDKWSETFDWFSRFTHSDENRAVLRFYRMTPPRERDHYSY
jgi:hypothetical protein